jgi:hypothetical protein
MLSRSVRVGFEVEFLHPVANRVTLRTDLSTRFGWQFGLAWPNWDLKDDGSLDGRGEAEREMTGHELVTPPQDISTGLTNLKHIFDWITETGGLTNSTTGLHVGISIGGVDLREKLDPLKLILISRDEEILQQFKRGGMYSRSHTNHIVENEPRDIKTARSYVSDYRLSINTGKATHTNCNYVEFRSMGNKGYHLRFPEIRRNVIHYAASLVVASDESRGKEVFKKALRSKLKIAA